MKGIILIPSKPLSEEAKAKLKVAFEKRKGITARLIEKMKKDAEDGVYDNIIKTL